MKSLRTFFLAFVTFFSSQISAQNYAVSFDGTDDYISIPSNIFSSTVTNFTIECWIKPNSGSFNSAYHGIIGFQSGVTSGDRNPGLWINNGAIHYDMYQPTTNTRYTGLTNAVVSQDKWSHLAMVKSGTTLYIYVNGKLEVNTTVSSTVKVVGNYRIGYIDNYFSGLIDEVRFWSVARTQQEIVSTLIKSPAYNATGLIAYYKMNAGTGTSAVNTCTNTSSINGTLTNGPTWSSNTSLSFATNAVSLSAASDYLQADISSAGSNKLTMECWVKFNSLTGQQNFLGMYQSLGTTSYCRAIPYKNTSNYIDFYISNTSGVATNTTTSFAVSAGTWYHMAFVYDNQKSYIYINGTLQASNTSASAFTLDGADVLVVGTDRAGGNVGINADITIDELRIWTTARTGAEIQEYMDKFIPLTTSGLLSYYSFDHGNPANSNTDMTQVYNELNNGNLYFNNVTLSSTASNFVAQPSTIRSNFIWNGNTSTAFNTSSNWAQESVPSSGSHIEISSAASNFPSLDQNRTVGDVALPSTTKFSINGYTLTVGGKVTGTGSFVGSSTSSFTYNSSYTNSTIYFDATTNLTTNSLSTLTIMPGVSGVLTLGNALYINSYLDIPWGNLNTAGYLTLRSTASGTAMVGNMSDLPTITGNITVERYIPGRRAFRLLTSPVTTTTTIYQNWQENGSSTSGYGTHITGSSSGSNGFDQTVTGNPSLFTFDNGTSSWASVSSTNNATNDKLTAGNPYRLLVRGDRTISLSSNAPTATNTTLRASGELFIGTKTFSGLNTSANAFSLVANPYQSAVNMGTLLTSASYNTNLNTVYYYIWDPTVGTRGAYVTVDVVNNTNNVSGSSANKFLQPWQACFVKTKNAGAASLKFIENAKTTTTSSTWRESFEIARLDVNLFQTDSFKKKLMPLDGLQVRFDPSYSSEIDDFDASKPWNQDENFSIFSQNQKLSIESKAFPTEKNDTVQLVLEQTRHIHYTIVSFPQYTDGYQLMLRDDFIGRSIPLANNEKNEYSFTIDPQIEASKNPNRFKIVTVKSKSDISDVHTNSTLVRSYPNPSNSKVLLESILKMEKLKIFNLEGQLISEKYLHNCKSIEVGDLQKGVYLFEVLLENGRKCQLKQIVI